MEKEIAMGFGVSVICLLASSFVAPSQETLPNSHRAVYSASSRSSRSSESSAQATVANLPDGHHQFCRESASATGTTVKHCFLFQKENDYIVGQYQSPVSSNSNQIDLCLAGQVDGNVVSGKATYFSENLTDPVQQRSELQVAELTNWDVTGETDYLKVAEGQAVDLKTVSQDSTAIESSHAVHFGKATLDLSDFQRSDTVSASPPTSCDA